MDTVHGEYKIPGGKLVVADIKTEGSGADASVGQAVISGDFFLEPSEALLAINAALVGLSTTTPVTEMAAHVARAAGPGAQFIGFSPEAVAIAVRRA
ncbi:MAG: lipoate--protein ligase, partial [Actinobacteria bacterium HGW-Actinobacteria-8]